MLELEAGCRGGESRRLVRIPCVADAYGSQTSGRWHDGIHCLESTGACLSSDPSEAVRTTPSLPPHLYSVCPLNHRLSQIRQSA